MGLAGLPKPPDAVDRVERKAARNLAPFLPGRYREGVRRLIRDAFALALAASTLVVAPPADAGPPKPASSAKQKGAKPTRRAMRAEQGKARARGGAARKGQKSQKSQKSKARRQARPVRARSVGYPNAGRLEGGVRLDLRPSYLHLVQAYAGDVRWGLPELVGAIDRAARAVARKHPGASLGVGDLSRRRGGEVRRHGSHESGRDADLAFYAVDRSGKSFRADRFVAFDGSLRSTTHPGVRFDVAKNWLLVQNLLLDPKARVSHIFVADPLKYRLLAHAKRRGVSQALLRRAAVVMLQPTNALAHDDHFHVRISCPGSASGCIEVAKDAPSKAKKAKQVRARKARAARAAKARAAKARAARAAKAGPARPKAKPRPKTKPRAAAPRRLAAPAAPAAPADEDREAMEAVDEAGMIKITD